MNIEELREYCLHKPAVTECFPFDETTLVFKVMDKMFLLTDLNAPLSVNIKNSPEKVIALKEEYADVLPGYHMNKTHWVTVNICGTISDKQIYQWIDESYQLIVSGLKRKDQEILKRLTDEQ
jgi:predicted DNA-binding protein (MmcQ/YjbR family)